MKGFFKIVLATFFALILFTVIGIFIFIGLISSASMTDKPIVGSRAVLVLNLEKEFREQHEDNLFTSLMDETDEDVPALYEIIRLINHARSDSAVKGIYVQCATNANGYAASEEIRKALIDFKKSGKFVVAHGEVISQKGYYVGSAADAVYCNPQGGVEWTGLSTSLYFLKGTLDKLEIQPQIFYAGKFKSATEPLRETKMTDANKLQTGVWLGELYNNLLKVTAASRKKDTAYLRNLASTGAVLTANDALQYGLVDGLKYDDEIKAILLKKLQQGGKESINFVSLGNYKAAADYKKSGSSKIALVYANGSIVSGEGDNEQIGSDQFRNLLRKIRLDKEVEAVVFRVNSPGGSALASEVIWREISLLRKEKPVVVSMGDVAASGGYYIACNADSVFANANTITGSIGVFTVIPNMQSFFKNKLGVTFDGVKTAPYADMGGVDRALTEPEKRFVQASVDTIYHVFKTRVSGGRRMKMDQVDSLAQGRVWTGAHAQTNQLVDRIGTLQDAVESAARMAKIGNDYRLKEYPEKKTLLEQLMSSYKKTISEKLIGDQFSLEEVRILKEMKQIKAMNGVPQAKLPFTLAVH
ncbi:MAG: signal peptide peptidase SppA [Sphingobacteriia bacterium]|nr:signal peptide peptidase SppA [Sphingobacteriia bacterium]